MRSIKLSLFLFFLSLSLSPLYSQAVYDTSLDLGASTSATFTTPAFTVGGGSNRIVLVYTHSDLNSAGYITGVTYNGVAMTSAAAVQACNPANAITATMWYLVAPASGAHTFVISSAGGNTTQALAIAYSNASQTGVPDSTSVNCFGQAGGDIIYNVSITTVAANCVLVMGVAVGNYDNTGATGNIKAFEPTLIYIADRTVTSTGANSISLESILNGGVETGMITVALAPAAGGGGGPYQGYTTILANLI